MLGTRCENIHCWMVKTTNEREKKTWKEKKKHDSYTGQESGFRENMQGIGKKKSYNKASWVYIGQTEKERRKKKCVPRLGRRFGCNRQQVCVV